MSVPGLNPFVPPEPAPAPVPPQIQPPRPGSPTLRNRPAQHDRQAEEDTASGSGLKRGRPSEAEEEGMDIESSIEPQLKRRRGEGEAATPERLQALVGNMDPREGLIREMQEVRDTITTTSSDPRMAPFYYAASRGFESVVRHLVDFANYQDVNIAFVYAIKSGHLNIVELLYAHGANLGVKDASGKGCLHYAVESRNLVVLEWLLKKSFDVDAPTKSGITPLMVACRSGHLGTAQMLVARGANLAITDRNGDNCLHYAATNNCAEIVAWLLDQHMSVNEPNKGGRTPLIYACGRGHLGTAQMLVACGANLAITDRNGYNCLHHAADKNQAETVAWLLAQHMSVNEPTQVGLTPLMVACSRGHLGTAQMLVTRGANLAITDSNGDNCLHYAANNNCAETVAWLLAQGAPADGGVGAAMTPLRIAFSKLSWNVVAVLIKGGANLWSMLEDGAHIGDAIFRQAMQASRYDVLLSLIAQDWQLPEDWDQIPESDSSDDSSEGSSDEEQSRTVRARSAAIYDLDRIFRGMVLQADLAPEDQVDQVLDRAWLSLEKKSDRQEFLDYYQTQFFLTDSNASNQSISETALSSHPLFSYTIYDHLKPQQGEFTHLLQALVGEGRAIIPSLRKKIFWFKLEALKAAQVTQPFQNKHLLPATENIICNVLTRQLDALRLAAQEYFINEQANFSEVLTELCKKYIRMDGRFDANGLNKALIKQGIYAVNADRLTALISAAFEVVRRRPLDLPSMTTVGRAFDLNAPQVIENLFAELKKSLLYLAKAHEIESLELADSEEQDSYPGLSAKLKKPLNHPPDASVLPGFAAGLAGLEQKDQDIYVEQIFGQWRLLSAALGVVLPELFASQQ